MTWNLPYIGVTGFMKQKEVNYLLAFSSTDRLLGVGVLASTTTVYGERPRRYFGCYPQIEEIANIFSPDSRAFNIIHFNDKTGDDNKLLEQLVYLTEVGGENFHGFQLNMVWPNPKVLESYLKLHPKSKIILQISKKALLDVSFSPQLMAGKIATEYRGLVNYVLLDQSGGHGRELDFFSAWDCVNILKMFCDSDIGIGVAGGLFAGNVWRLFFPLERDHHALSCDAQGRLHNMTNGGGLILQAAKKYIQTVMEIIKKVRQDI